MRRRVGVVIAVLVGLVATAAPAAAATWDYAAWAGTKRQVVVIGVEGLNQRSCLPIMGDTFAAPALKRMGPYVARMAATGRLPG